MPRTSLNWDTDVKKHYVRLHAWLPAALAQREATLRSGRPVTYLTFCAAQALDVFLFLNTGVLVRDAQTDIVSNTYFCEKSADVFQAISDLVGPHDQGFFGDFQEMVLFEDDEFTLNRHYEDPTQRYKQHERKRLNVKRRYERFKSVMPFDIINLDICGTMFPSSAGVHSPMLKSVDRLLGWQAACSELESFTLFLTTHIEESWVSSAALGELVSLVNNNGNEHAGYADRLRSRFGSNEAAEIAEREFVDFYCLAVPKIIVSKAFENGWLVEPGFVGVHTRDRTGPDGGVVSTYSMLSWVGKFARCSAVGHELRRSVAPETVDYSRAVVATTGTEVVRVGWTVRGVV